MAVQVHLDVASNHKLKECKHRQVQDWNFENNMPRCPRFVCL